MRKSSFILAIAVTLSGCAPLNKQTITTKSLADMRGQTITYTARKKPDFSAATAGKAVFGMLGAFSMISEGNAIIARNNVADPADTIATGLAKELETVYGTRLVTPPARVGDDDPSRIAASVNGAARFVIDAQTVNWSFGYFPTDWTHYRVIYTAKARLIDTQTRAVIAQGFCKHFPDNSPTAPTYDALLANEAARLKAELNAVAIECVKSMKVQMLSLPS